MLISPKKFMPTYMLIAINVIVYVCTSIVGGDFITTSDSVLVWYGQVNYLVLRWGWYWQLFTALFIHVNIMHLLGNMFFLLIFGLRAEELFTLPEYLLIYFVSGLAGNILTLLMGPTVVSAGASGAIFGVFGACIIYFRRAIGQSIIGALLYAFFLLMINVGPNVNFLAHLGGLAVGLAMGYGFAARRKFKVVYRYVYSFSPDS